MKRILAIVILVIFTGCTETEYKTEETISDYVINSYKDKLLKNDIFHIKCFYSKDRVLEVVYSKIARDNNFPAVIRIDRIGNSYSIKFDDAYLNNDKNKLLTDIDFCMSEFERIQLARTSWK